MGKRSGETDARGRLESDPFDAQVAASGDVRISRGGRVVTVLRGAAAERLAARLAKADERATQLLLAKATGHYKH